MGARNGQQAALRRMAAACATAVVLFVLPTQRTSAQGTTTAPAKNDEVARNLFQAGKVAFDSGSYEDALQYFEQSFERSHRPELQYNIGLAADRLRQDDKALTSFKTYLDQVPQTEKRDEVEGRIRALEKAKAARAATATAPSPEQTARSANVAPTSNDVALTSTEPRDDRAKPITKQWWFWTGVGVVVAGGVITAIALSSGGQKESTPFASRTGVTVMTLRSR